MRVTTVESISPHSWKATICGSHLASSVAVEATVRPDWAFWASSGVSVVGSVAFLVPGTRWLFGEITDRLVKGSTGGPDEGERARSGSHVVGLAYGEAGVPDQLV